MNLWDHLYQVQKNGNNKDQQKFKNVKYEVDSMIKTSYSSYLDSIVGIIDDSDPAENARPNTEKNSYLKNCRQGIPGRVPLKEKGKTCTDNVKNANLLNIKFQSVFTPKSPLQLKQLCQKRCKTLMMQATTDKRCHNHLMTSETNIQICWTSKFQ